MGIKASAQYTIAEIHEECNVVISNDSHVFRADKDNTAVAGNTSIQIYGYQGNTQVATTIGTISGLPSAGMTATINNNGKTNTSITVAVTTALTSSVANNGTLTIPVTVAGKTFNKTFSWSKAQTGATGATGEKGETGAPGKDGTNGTSARTYWVTSSANTVTRSMKGTLTPATITFSSYYRDGTNATSTAYAGRFIIQESSNGTSWTTKYTSSANESSKAYTPTATTNLVRCAMYAAGGTTNKLDELTIGIIDSIDDLEIGGRNFILNTKTAITFSDATTDKLILSNYAKNLVKENDTLTLSFDAKASASLFIDFYWRSNDTSYASTSFLPGTALTTEYQHFTFTSTAGLDLLTNKILYLRVRQSTTLHGSATAVGTVEIKNVKLEKSTRASDWTPAPEDTMPPEVIIGTQTTATNVWTGIASFEKLIDGQQIAYWLPYAGTSTSATLNLTLADGTTTGAKNVYYQGTTRMTTHSPAGSVIHLTYRENATISGSTTKYTGWWGDATYNSDTYDRIRYNSAITAVTAISSGRIITGTASGFKHIAASTAFDINKPILYAGSAIAAAATGTNNFIAYSNLNLASTKSGFTGTKGKTVYIVGTLNGTTFTPNSTLFTTTEPTTEDGLVYIALGVMSSTTNSTLFPEHPLYKFVNGKFQTLSQVAYEAQDNLDNLAIGSRNFILNSDRVLENTATAVGQSVGITPPSQVSDDMASCIKKGDKLDYSIEIKVDGDLTFGTTNPYVGLEVAYQYTKTDGTTANAYLSVTAVRTELNDETKYPKGKWVRIHKINTMSYDPTKWHQPTWLIRDTTGQISTRRPQVCIANKETDWTPASEDQISYTDDVVKRANDSLKDYIDGQNALISGEVARVDESIGERITENNQNIINQVSSSVKEEFDKTTGEKIRDLEKYTSHFKVTGNALTYNIDKTKGTNLIKNSVMLQNKTNANKKTKANFWLNKALQEDYFTHVTSNDADSVRAKTTSGSAIVLDYTVDSTNLTYDYILSAPIDFKLDTDNIMLSYKIKGAVSAGHFFIGLVFYKKDNTETGLGASAAFTQSTGIPTAHYLALKEYTTGKEFTDFTKDYILKTTPFVKSDKKIVNYSCEVSASNTITLPFAPYLVNGTCTVTVYDLNGEEIKINTTGTTVNLGDGDWPAMVAVQYERALSNFSGTTASSITASNFSTVLDNEVLMYYNTSDNKIWVYNPFTGTYVKSANLYSGTDYSEVDSVRVILGVRGASTSAKFSGHIEVSDLKVEYDSLSQIWTQHPGETYSKLYQMDEKGFSISSDTNMMFIDEDEIAAYTLDAEGKPETDNPVFQISGEKTILKKTVIREDLLIENSTATEQSAFIMKQYNVGNQWYFLFY